PNKLINDVVWYVGHHDAPIKNERISIKKKLREYGKERFFGLIDVKFADNEAQATTLSACERGILGEIREKAEEIVDKNECFELSSLAVGGDDIILLGFSGTRIGEILERLLDEVVCERLPNEREKLLGFAAKRFKR
ncbi:MAG: polynucleotide adenylyltransferase, partial [Clostridia bacterium]|nr:polynucleotide adenylyltransferase [Clostridia bacterium]